MKIKPTERWLSDSIELFLLDPTHVTASYVSWLNNPLVNRFLESRFNVHTIESTQDFVAQCLESDTNILFGIRAKLLGNVHVGNIKLGPIDYRHGRGEIGILIGEPAAWGKGIASQAITQICEIARVDLTLRKITAGIYETNIGSIKAFQKVGFEIEGRRREHYIFEGKTEDLILTAKWLNKKTTFISNPP